jgi:methionine-rich copper-binding protein CopC
MAMAHDEVIATTPADGSSVVAGEINVTVTFSEDVMKVADNAGIAIAVTAPDGNVLTHNCLGVDGAVISSTIDIDQPGKYQVEWQSVSADGHPSTGKFAFTATNDNGYVASAPKGCDPVLIAPAPQNEPTPTLNGDLPAAGEDSGSGAWLWGAIGAAAVALAYGGYLWRRRKLAAAKAND